LMMAPRPTALARGFLVNNSNNVLERLLEFTRYSGRHSALPAWEVNSLAWKDPIMDRQLHISRVIFVFLADGTERCYHWQNHDHDVFLFLRPPSRLQDLMQSLLYSGMCHMASARFTACLYWVQLISSPYLFIYYAFKAPVICYCLFFFFFRVWGIRLAWRIG
jgi:hypothetical protein